MTIKFNPLIILFFLTSCGGGSGSLDINQNDDPIINISSNLNEQLITKYVTLSCAPGCFIAFFFDFI